MKKVDPRIRRNDAFLTAKKYARVRNLVLAQAWLERADRYMPLTVQQVWRFKTILGPETFNDIAPPRVRDLDISPEAQGHLRGTNARTRY